MSSHDLTTSSLTTSDEMKRDAGPSSALLLSSIPDPLFASSILGFLKKKDILGVLSIPEINEWFHLEEYCCSRHGTLRKTTEIQKQKHFDAFNKMMVCEDCIHAREDWHKCNACDRFSQESDIHVCEGGDGACQVKICNDCLRKGRGRREFRSNYCTGCDRFICGRRIRNKCGFLQKCSDCNADYCNQCVTQKMCAGCKEFKDCPCFWLDEEDEIRDNVSHFTIHPGIRADKLRNCQVCMNCFCSDCRHWQNCSTCKGDVCSVCVVLRRADPNGFLWCSKPCLEEYIQKEDTK